MCYFQYSIGLKNICQNFCLTRIFSNNIETTSLIKILQWNARSLKPKLVEFEIILQRENLDEISYSMISKLPVRAKGVLLQIYNKILQTGFIPEQ